MNYEVFQLINGWAGRSALLDGVLTFAATWLIWPVFAVAGWLGLAALRRREWQAVIATGAALVLAFVASLGLQHLSHQLRPFQSHQVHQLVAHDGGVSLPSDHATAAFTLAFAVGVFLHGRWGAVLAVGAVLIGFARVFAGLHYPGDILAAAVIAGLAVLEVKVFLLWRPAAEDGEVAVEQVRRPTSAAPRPRRTWRSV